MRNVLMGIGVCLALVSPASLRAQPVSPPAEAQPATPTTQPAAALERVRADERRRVETLARAARAVVCIFADSTRGGGGSGVLIDEQGHGLTNFHVVQEFVESRRGVGGLSDGNLYPLRVLGIDPGGDVALFKLEGRERFDFAPLGDSDLLHVGQPAAALGNPFVLAEDNAPTVTLGVISGLQRYQGGQGNLLEYADCIQVSTSINPGNSGGPLFDLAGRVIGINGRAAFEERGRVNVGLGFAITINQIKRFIPALRAGRLVQHGTLGATVREAGKTLIFDAVQDLSPAEKAGVQLGDELRSINGRPIRSANAYNNLIATLPADWPVTLRVLRGDKELTLSARLEALPLRGGMVYLTDAALNRAEAARLMAAARRAVGSEAVAEGTPWRGVIALSDAAGKATKLAMTQAPLQRVELATEGNGGPPRVVAFEAAPGDAATTDAGAPAGGMSDAFWEEWQQISGPLLTPVEIDRDWQVLGGDEVDGRIAGVVERRFESGRRIRWKIDWSSGAPLAVTLGDAQTPEAVVWRVANDQSEPWPALWTRRGADRSEVQLRFEHFAPQEAP